MLYMLVWPICMPQFVQTGLLHRHKHGMNWCAKMTRDVRLTSKNKVTSKSTQTHLWLEYTVTEKGHTKCIKAFSPLLTYELIMVMPFIIQSVPLFPTLYGPDLSHCSLAEAPLTLRTREGPYALCLHATHSPRPHETFCHHALCLPVEASTTQRDCVG